MGVGAVAIRTKDELGQFLDSLDEKSRTILWHLWWNRHASIAELRSLVDASSDFDILSRLKDVINKKAQEVQSKPIVGFEQSKTDPLTGEKVLFEWWFLDEQEEDFRLNQKGRPLIDVFDEKETFTIIVTLPAFADVSSAKVEAKNGIMKVTLRKCPDGTISENGKIKSNKDRDERQPTGNTTNAARAPNAAKRRKKR